MTDGVPRIDSSFDFLSPLLSRNMIFLLSNCLVCRSRTMVDMNLVDSRTVMPLPLPVELLKLGTLAESVIRSGTFAPPSSSSLLLLAVAAATVQSAARSMQVAAPVWPLLCFLWPRFHLTYTAHVTGHQGQSVSRSFVKIDEHSRALIPGLLFNASGRPSTAWMIMWKHTEMMSLPETLTSERGLTALEVDVVLELEVEVEAGVLDVELEAAAALAFGRGVATKQKPLNTSGSRLDDVSLVRSPVKKLSASTMSGLVTTSPSCQMTHGRSSR